MTQKITALVGAQYGSEGKGVVAAALANEYDVHVRTGGPNAGHSFVHNRTLYKMQCIPCGWVNPHAILILGAGAVINGRIFNQELSEIEKVYPDIRGRIEIDHNAMILEERHEKEEGHTKGEIHKRIGSTGEGVGAARIDHIRRDSRVTHLAREQYITSDTAIQLFSHRAAGHNILLEGTQGCGLSLTHGNWPYVTSHDTNAAQLAADAGLPPQCITDVYLVARSYPIRVHGNSGPMRGETNWGDLSERLGRKVKEQTTVTKLTRRLGTWDDDLISKAKILNDPTGIILTFIDYLNKDDQFVTKLEDLSSESRSFIESVERGHQIPVVMIGTGFDPEKGWSFIDRRNNA